MMHATGLNAIVRGLWKLVYVYILGQAMFMDRSQQPRSRHIIIMPLRSV